jgi:hypothetical protein
VMSSSPFAHCVLFDGILAAEDDDCGAMRVEERSLLSIHGSSGVIATLL